VSARIRGCRAEAFVVAFPNLAWCQQQHYEQYSGKDKNHDECSVFSTSLRLLELILALLTAVILVHLKDWGVTYDAVAMLDDPGLGFLHELRH